MTRQRILLTGASGCIGHYIGEALIQETNHELYFLVRQLDKLKLETQSRSGVTVLSGDMLTIAEYRELLGTIDIAILTATVWGGDQVYRVNVEKTLELLDYLKPEVCQRVLYFSTASILDRQLQLLPEAETLGTDYIRSKFLCLQKLHQHPLREKITALFPTLVFGGDSQKPYSHLSGGLPEVLRWTGLLRFLKVEGSFHLIHGQDIATVVLYLVNQLQSYAGERLVLGNAEITVNQCLQTLCRYNGEKVLPPLQVSLTLWLANLLITLFRIRVAAWDYFCLNYRYFGYENPINPDRLGLTPYCPTLEDALRLTDNTRHQGQT